LCLAGRAVLLVGGGPVAAQKLPGLLAAGARVTVVAPTLRAEFQQTVGLTLHARAFEPGDLDGVWFVVAAATPEVNRAVAVAAAARRVFVNAVDDPAHASALLGGVVRRAGVTLAISTGGVAPALAGLLREALERMLPDDLDGWVNVARQCRARWLSEGRPMAARRPLLLEALNALYAERPVEARP
jgi:uroporphyrin-III C-methyltransferase/precorrin-2 dehydrogenase/sirohydrochlorin ferrochelatase